MNIMKLSVFMKILWTILYELYFVKNHMSLLRWVAVNPGGLSGQDRQFDLLYAVLTRPEECIHHAKASQFIATLRVATFLLAMFPSITSASSRLDKLVGGKAEKYGTRLLRYLLLYLPWYPFFSSSPFFTSSFVQFFFLSFFLYVSVFPYCCDNIYDKVYLSHYKRGQALRAPGRWD